MTAALQQFSRKTHIAIDILIFRTEVLKINKLSAKPPDKGI